MNRKKIYALLLFLASLFLSCSEKLEIKPYTYTQIFTGESKKGWSIRNVQYLQEGKGTQTFGLPDCVEDDIYVFYANAERRYVIQEGSSKCAPEDSDTILEDTWAFSQATATLTIIIPLLTDAQPLPFILKEAENDRMSMEFYFEDNSSYRFNFRSVSLE